jgi:hypothetical protein
MSQAFTGLRSRNGRLCAVMAALILPITACHKKPETPPAPAPVVAPAPKPSQPLPARKAGLWQTTITEDGSADPAQVIQVCLDAKVDQHLGILGNDLSGDSCTKTAYAAADGKSWELLAECQMGTGVVTQYSGSINGDYSRDYTLKVRSQTLGGNLPQMNRVTNYRVTSKRVGNCAKDQKPGDLVSDGVKVNLFDIAGQGNTSAPADAPPKEPVD